MDAMEEGQFRMGSVLDGAPFDGLNENGTTSI
jgi:hypothetical protein